jgi:hypothetical protein
MNNLETLDPDEGIRARGKHNKADCFIFITKPTQKYVVAIFGARKNRNGAMLPSNQIALYEFTNKKGLEEFLSTLLIKPIKAYRY